MVLRIRKRRSEDFNYEICDPMDNIFKKSVHHNPVLLEISIIEFKKSFDDTVNVCNLDFKIADYNSLNNFLFSLNWDEIGLKSNV